MLSTKFNDKLDDKQKEYLEGKGGLTIEVIRECLCNKKIGVNIDEQSFIDGIVFLQNIRDNMMHFFIVSQ